MVFFAIAASVMAVCIIAINRITKYFGAELPLFSLALCGLSALVINFSIISVEPFLTKSYYYMVAAMVVGATFGTTCCNGYLSYRKAKLAGAIAAVDVDAAANHDDHKEEAEPAPAETVDNTVPVHLASKKEHTALPRKKGTRATTDRQLEKKLASMTTMDQLLDFAFEEGTKQHKRQALRAYEVALERYRDDSYAPFIVIEITNIHKASGRYATAVQCFRDAMDIPAIRANPSIKEQFTDSINYLEAAQDVLADANLTGLPLSDVPQSYLLQIESIYTSRKSR